MHDSYWLVSGHLMCQNIIACMHAPSSQHQHRLSGMLHCQATAQVSILVQDENLYTTCTGKPQVMNSARMLRRREQHIGARSGFSPAQCCHLGCFQYLPSRPSKLIDKMHSRVYIGNFSKEGNVFVGKLAAAVVNNQSNSAVI